MSDDIATLTGIQEIFYRIKIFHSTGSFFYSPVIKVNVKSSTGSVKTFISNNQLCISGSFPQPGICRLDLYSLQGAPLMQTTFNVVAGYNSITITLKNYAAGTYIVQVSGKNGRITTAKVIIP